MEHVGKFITIDITNDELGYEDVCYGTRHDNGPGGGGRAGSCGKFEQLRKSKEVQYRITSVPRSAYFAINVQDVYWFTNISTRTWKDSLNVSRPGSAVVSGQPGRFAKDVAPIPNFGINAYRGEQ